MKKLIGLAIIVGLVYVLFAYGNIDTKRLGKDSKKVLSQASTKVEKTVKTIAKKAENY